MFIALDGYNFIKQSPELRRLEQIELQKAREALIDQLAQYKRLKGHPITVVFDGWQQGGMAGHPERSKGIGVIFSKAGEKADDVLKRLAAEKKGGILIVTSDQEVASFAEERRPFRIVPWRRGKRARPGGCPSRKEKGSPRLKSYEPPPDFLLTKKG